MSNPTKALKMGAILLLLIGLSIVGLLALSGKKATKEPAPVAITPDQKSTRVTPSPSVVTFTKSLKKEEIPADLYAKSAIKVSYAGGLTAILSDDEKAFNFPLTESRSCTLKINKVVSKGTQHTLFGSIEDVAKSYFSLVLRDDAIHSGAIHYLDPKEQFVITPTSEQQYIVTETDYSITIPHHGSKGHSGHAHPHPHPHPHPHDHTH